MPTREKQNRLRLRLILAALALAVVLAPISAPAADKYWIGGSDW